MVTVSGVASVLDATLTFTLEPAFVSITSISIVLLEPYSARSSASAPAPFPTPPVSTSANGCGPIGTVGAATRTVHTPVAGAETSTHSSTLTLS